MQIRSKQPFVQLLRFLAAILVCFFHYRAIYRQTGGNESVALLFDAGWMGVQIFFVISGFVMVAGSSNTIGAGEFIHRRIARIFPPLWIAVALFLAATYMVQGKIPSIADTLRSATLLDASPIPDRHALYVTWSLSFELMFYAAFAAYIAFGRKNGTWFLIAGAATIETVRIAYPTAPILLTSRETYNFLLGCLAGVSYQRFSAYSLPVFAVGGLLLVAGFAWHMAAGIGYSLTLVGVGTALAIYGSKAFVGGRFDSAFEKLGDISYAMYLLHPTIIIAMGSVWWGPVASSNAKLATFTLAATGLSYAFFTLVEKPATKAFLSITRSRPRPQVSFHHQTRNPPTALPLSDP